jgi:hypothetical protein
MGSGAMIYIPSFIKTGSKVDRGNKQAARRSHNPISVVFQSKENSLTIIIPYLDISFRIYLAPSRKRISIGLSAFTSIKKIWGNIIETVILETDIKT